MLRLFCCFERVHGLEDFFSPASIKKGTLLVKHVFATEERLGDDGVSLHAKCVSQVKDSLVYDITIVVSVPRLFLRCIVQWFLCIGHRL